MLSAPRSGIGTLLLAAAVLVACGKKEQAETPAPAATSIVTATDSAATDSAATPAAAPLGAAGEAAAGATASMPGGAPSPADHGPTPASLAPADVDAYRRGQEAELARIETLLGDMVAAKDDQEKAAVLTRIEDRAASEEHGAQAAGMDVARYRAVSATVDDVILRWRRSIFVSRMAQDTTRFATLPPEKVAPMRAALAAAKAPYTGLPPETVASVVPRVSELDSLHVIVGALVNQATRAAGAPPASTGGH